MNTVSVKLSMTVQNVFTYAKVFALALIIFTGIVQLCLGMHSPICDTVLVVSVCFTGSSCVDNYVDIEMLTI